MALEKKRWTTIPAGLLSQSFSRMKKKIHFINQSKLVSFCHSQNMELLALADKWMSSLEFCHQGLYNLQRNYYLCSRKNLFILACIIFSCLKCVLYVFAFENWSKWHYRNKFFYYCNWNTIWKMGNTKQCADSFHFITGSQNQEP